MIRAAHRNIRDKGFSATEMMVVMLVTAIISAIGFVGLNSFQHSSNLNTLSNFIMQIKQASVQYEKTNGSNANISCNALVSSGDWPVNGCVSGNLFQVSVPGPPSISLTPVSGQDLEFTITVNANYFTASDLSNLCLQYQTQDVSCTAGVGTLAVTF